MRASKVSIMRSVLVIWMSHILLLIPLQDTSAEVSYTLVNKVETSNLTLPDYTYECEDGKSSRILYYFTQNLNLILNCCKI